jgi:DNA-binding transcriptional LysR family regulator
MTSLFQGQIAETDLRLLKVFRTIVERGGFTAAEVALGKSKSAISADIAALEHRFGMKLCVRGRGGFALTAEGEQVREAVEHLFSDLDRFRDRVNRTRTLLSGTLTLYVTDNIVIYGESPLVYVLGEFAKRHPDVYIHLSSAPANEVELALLDGRTAIGVSVMSHLTPSLESLPLFKEELYLYCGARHPLFGVPAERLTPDEIRRHRIVAVSAAAVAHPSWQAWCESLVFSAHAGSVDARAVLLLSGGFLGFLPTVYAEPWVRDNMMRALNPESLSLSHDFHVLTRRGASAGLIVEEFKAMLLQAFAEDERGHLKPTPPVRQ